MARLRPSLAAFFFFLSPVSAGHVGRHRDLIHRLEKITPAAVLPASLATPAPVRRDDSACPQDHALCPASLSGGCCPSAYSCATDSCYATTSGTAGNCGSGFYFCDPSIGAGCCPNGYVCGETDCSPPPGVSATSTSCSAGYHLCPASLSYGCCRDGFGCATDSCFRTAPSTETRTVAVTTTNSDAQTVTTSRTATTVVTPTASANAGPPTASGGDGNIIAKFTPTKVAKIPASSTPESDGGGLTKAQIGGIIGGAVAILLIAIATAVFVIKRLNRVSSAIESRRRSSGGGGGGSGGAEDNGDENNGGDAGRTGGRRMSQYPKPSSFDQDTSGYAGASSRGRGRSDSDYSTSRQPSPYTFPRGPPSDVVVDVPARVNNFPGRRSTLDAADYARLSHDGQAGSAQQLTAAAQHRHGRHWSSASEPSAPSSSEGALAATAPTAELGIDGGFIPELPTTPAESGPRRWSDSNVRSGRSDVLWSSSAAPPPPALDPVNESAEVMHGYYGPPHQQAGQTAVGLEDPTHDLSTPVRVEFRRSEGQ